MKKSYARMAALALVIPVIFFGCATFSELVDNVKGVFSSDGGSSSGAETAEKTSEKKTLLSSGYKTPQSYEKAYSYRTDTADSRISAYIKTKNVDALRTTSQAEYVKTVTAKINELAADDFERVKLAHDAICLLVSYDAKNFWANTVPDQSWQNVVKTKTAVCEGYANLFQKFMGDLGITAQKVSGYARGVGTDITNENPKNSNHAWNIVKIEDCWYVIDCTWDSGYMNGKNSVQAYTTDWLFLRPEFFVYSHFPDSARNQLLSPALSQSEFSALPDFRPKLFEATGESLSGIKKTTDAQDFLELEYNIADGFSLSFEVAKVTAGTRTILQNRTLTERTGDSALTRINFPEAGTYFVSIFYKKDGQKTSWSCGQLMVTASAGNSVAYPALYQTSVSAKIITPKESPLSGGQTYDFAVEVPGKSFVAVIVGKNFNQLENDGNGTFSGQVQIPKGAKQVSIGFSNSATGRYEMLAVYEVQ